MIPPSSKCGSVGTYSGSESSSEHSADVRGVPKKARIEKPLKAKRARPFEEDDEMLALQAKKLAGMLVKKDKKKKSMDKRKKKKKERKKRNMKLVMPPIKLKFARIPGTKFFAIVK